MPETLVTALIKIGVGAGLSTAAATTVANLAVSVVVSSAAQLIAAAQTSGADMSREMTVPKSLPPRRFAYGNARIQGTWAPGWVVQDGILYGCIILNSRPSELGDFTVWLDRREVGLSGDAYDFGEVQSGTATVLEGNTTVTVSHGLSAAPSAAHVKAWLGDLTAVVGSITSTTFQITIASAAPAGGTEVEWTAIIPSPGATAVNYPFASHFSMWLGRGDQTSPPAQILAEKGDLSGRNPTRFWPTDRWAGRTVMWVRMVAGSSEERLDRWPSSPPSVEIQSLWTPVWDPRDEAQDPDDPDTWEASGNQGRCLLDALRHNPVARYSLDQIDLTSLEDAADLADEAVPLKAGGAEPRYRVAGLLVFSGTTELSDQIAPLVAAGAGQLVKIGGKVAYSPGAWVEPEVTLSKPVQSEPIRFTRTQPSRARKSALKASFSDPAAEGEMGELYPIAIVEGWDGSDEDIATVEYRMVTSATQAMRLQQIEARRLQYQRALKATFMPSAIEAVAGGTVEIAFPREGDARNGTYRVTAAHPAEWLNREDGVSFLLPLEMREDAEAIYAWDPDTDEQERIDVVTIPVDPSMPVLTDIDPEPVGEGLLDPIYLTLPYDSADETFYYLPDGLDAVRWEYRRNQSPWQLGGVVDVTSPVTTLVLEVAFTPVVSGSSYDIRARCESDDGRVGAWLYERAVQVGFTLGAPTSTSAVAGSGAGEIDVAATAPSDTDCAAVQIWIGTTDEPEEAFDRTQIAADPSDPVTYTATGLTAGTLHYAFVRAVTASGAVGPWAATLTATPT